MSEREPWRPSYAPADDNGRTKMGDGKTAFADLPALEDRVQPKKNSHPTWTCGVCGHVATFNEGETVEWGDPRFCEHGPKPVTYPDGTHVYGDHTAESNYGHYFPTGDEPECLRGCGVTNAELAARLGVC